MRTSHLSHYSIGKLSSILSLKRQISISGFSVRDAKIAFIGLERSFFCIQQTPILIFDEALNYALAPLSYSFYGVIFC